MQDNINNGNIVMPVGYYLTWSGQFEAEAEARKRLSLVLPICLVVIMLLLYVAFRDSLSVLLTTTAIPFALAGGVLSLALLNYKFSTAVWIGFIALFGIATDNAVVLLSTLKTRFKNTNTKAIEDIRIAVIDTGLMRVRPIMMTTLTTILALVPVMFFTSTGSEMIKPMASPIIGGLIAATFTNLFLVPVLFAWFKERKIRH